MRTRAIRWTAVVITCAWGASVSCAQGEWDASASVAVCTEEHDQQAPVVGSDEELRFVALWTDTRPEGKKEGTKHPKSVRGKFVKGGREFVVLCPPDSNAQDPAISGRLVVFTHNRGWTNVLMTELPECAAPKTVGSTAYSPAIGGGLIAFASTKHRWEEGDQKATWIGDILGYEVGGVGVTFDVVRSELGNQNAPDVAGTVVVWHEGRQSGGWSNTGIFKRDIDADPEPVRICKLPGKIAKNPAISGSVIVWQDNRNGNWDIYGYDPAVDTEIEICLDSGDQEAAAIHGDTVVWQDNRGGDWDIYGYDLSARRVFPIYKGKGDQTEPDIHDEVVAWTDTRNGNKDIYMNRRTRK